ncbi:MAG TPA: methylenetetrahydrofolate reductase [NAD(P)H], partial [Solirubrobacteraceae bacterium]|nr:methylenetetrahydrofolate reductase [NAD(P)H] [Solirubrobacteraceae bacterium]
KLRDIYAREGLTFSIEFFPPKSDEGVDNLFSEIEILKTLNPDFCSVTYGAGGSTQDRTVELVQRIHDDTELEVMCHLTVVNQPRSQVHGVLRRLRDGGIENIIALAGDPPEGATAPWAAHPDGYHHSRQLVEAAVAFDRAWFSVAVAGFPEIHPRAKSRESDLHYLKEKVDAGADAVITQLFFDNEDYYRFVEDCRALGITVPIVPGMLPVKSASQCRRFARMCGARIPRRLDALLDKVEDDDEAAVELGIEYCTEQCQGLLDFGVPGFHFYSLNKSRSVAAIHENLNLGALTAAAS